MKNDVFTILSTGFILFQIKKPNVIIDTIVRKNTPYNDYNNQISGGLK